MILVSISFWMKVPKASIPLFIIYLIFSFTQFSSSENKPIEDTVDSYDNDQNNEKNSLNDLENVEEIKIRGINNYVEPKPLIIEDKSGLSDHKRNEKEKFKKPEKEHSNKKLKSDDLNKPLILKDIKICKNIYKRTPVGADNIFTNNVDSLYEKALTLVLDQQKVSTSFIQRYLQIGYNRAARIVEKMEEDGFISEPSHAGKRNVLKKNK